MQHVAKISCHELEWFTWPTYNVDVYVCVCVRMQTCIHTGRHIHTHAHKQHMWHRWEKADLPVFQQQCYHILHVCCHAIPIGSTVHQTPFVHFV